MFAEQSSSASKMTAAKVVDATARLPGCDGQAAAAVSGFRRTKVESCSEVDSGSYVVFTRFVSFANDRCNSNECHCKTAKV